MAGFDKWRGEESRDEYKAAYTKYLRDEITEQDLLKIVDKNDPYLTRYNDTDIIEADVLLDALIQGRPEDAPLVIGAREWLKRVRSEYYGS